VVARLQGDVQRCATRSISRLFQSDNFRVIAPGVLVEAIAQDRPVFHQDAPYRGIRARQANAFTRQVQSMLHEMQIVIVHGIS
jgi:hypothetical protein